MVNKQRGFTLVEIAIVLVIIGLLLGGILKGQELITAARVRNLGDQTAGVQAAYYGFIDRYRAVPGDMLPDAACNAIGDVLTSCAGGGGGVGGNGDQVIEDFTEASAAWAHLAAAGFIQGNYSGAAGDVGAYTSAAIPAAPTNPWNGWLLLARTNNYLSATAPTPPRFHLIIGRRVPVNVMREFDLKVDDSLPRSGILRSAPLTDTIGTFDTVGGSSAAPLCVTGGGGGGPDIWDINSGSADCNGYFLF